MSLVGNVVVNNQNVLALLKIDQAFTFSDSAEMQTFIKSAYLVGTEPASNFCNQSQTDRSLFQCLWNYPYGIPNYKFNIQLSYNRQGFTGQMSLLVDPTTSALRSRSLK